MAKAKQIDMCNGPILSKIILFTIPVLFQGLLQHLYNMADLMVVGQFASEEALAAVGSSGSLTGLFINVFLGLSIGVNVVVAQYIGAGRKSEVPRIVSTALVLALVSGVLVGTIGFIFARELLVLMQAPSNVLPLAQKYVSIFFLGAPAGFVYNFCAAALRANGDTKRPMIYLAISGAVNVVFNLLFVICFGMDADGVALATIISQYLSAVMVLITLIKETDCCRLELKNFKFSWDKAIKIIKVGIPSGIYSSCFSISNVIIQSSINSFGSSMLVAGASAASNLTGIVYIACNSTSSATVSFVGQNYGANNFDRIKKIILRSIVVVLAAWAVATGVILLFRNPLLYLFLPSNPAAVEVALTIIFITASGYFILGIADVYTATLRGMGYSMITTVIGIVGTCISRVVWIYTVVEPLKASVERMTSIKLLYLIYPISWLLTLLALIIVYRIIFKKEKTKLSVE